MRRIICGLALALLPAVALGQATILTLLWDNVTDARQQGYIVQRTAKTCASAQAADFKEVGRVAKDVVTYADAGVVEGNDYCYRVAAFNPDVAGQWSNTAGKRVPFGAPGAVLNLRVN